MSRLHRQKLRLRAMQREEGIIDPNADAIDREAIEVEGTTHSHHLADDEQGEEGAAAAPSSAPKKTTKRKAKKASSKR